MVMDVLGVLIAFTSVILLLSIIVTSLSQLLQALFKVRARNLIVGMAMLLRLSRSQSGRPDKEDRKAARALLNTLEAGNIRPAQNPEKWWPRLLGPTVTWIDRATFERASTAVGQTSVATASHLPQDFKVAEAAMEKRFLWRMRLISSVLALLVAFVFQVHAPQLLHDLWLNPEQRKAIEAMADQVLTDSKEAIATFSGFENAADKALERLAENYPKSRAGIEEASGVGTTKAYVVEELRLTLENDPDRDKILKDYERLLGEEQAQYRDDLASAAQGATVTLASMHIEPWTKRWAYYWDHGMRWWNWGGMLIAAMLLTLGAPFWFNLLKALVNLRDSMKERLAPATKSN